MAIAFEGHKLHYICDTEADIDPSWEIGSKITCINTGKNYTMMIKGSYVANGYSDAETIASLLKGLTPGSNSKISSKDSILTALAKLQAQITAILGKLVRTTTPITGISIVTSASGGGIQISPTKDSTLHLSFLVSITAAVSGASLETLVTETCPTNSITASDWIEAIRTGDSQSAALAPAFQNAQPGYRVVSFDLPAGHYFRVREIGIGKYSGGFISGQKTIYG